MTFELTADCTAYTALVTAAALVIGYWVVSRAVTIQPSPRTVTTQPRGLYLTEALGRTRHLTQAKRYYHWKQALRYISRVLRIRKHWAATGKHLQQPRIRDLVSGVVRHRSFLRREKAAAVR